jgi:high-affinity K+ transport system ATPase subunit B
MGAIAAGDSFDKDTILNSLLDMFATPLDQLARWDMVDLDSSPTKLIDVIETGKQLLVTRGALTTFSIANDVSKYFAIISNVSTFHFSCLNIMRLHS